MRAYILHSKIGKEVNNITFQKMAQEVGNVFSLELLEYNINNDKLSGIFKLLKKGTIRFIED